MSGTLIVSLDFELRWGLRDTTTVDAYEENLRGVREAIPALLGLFAEEGIRATWATVGFLFFDSKAELLAHLPASRPAYDDRRLDPYDAFGEIGTSEAIDPYHFGASLIERIRRVPGQEIGSHTFSHYYALERGQSLESFRDDLRAALRAGRRLGLQIQSLVFPRNQYRADYLRMCRELGLRTYRGNAHAWLYEPRRDDDESLGRRALRLADAYVNLSGHNTYRFEDDIRPGLPLNLPASRFLRPWSPALAHLEEQRLRRIEDAMTYAARHDETFHLWWHPHNFGRYLAPNIANLKRLLNHFDHLRRRYAMESLSMGDVANRAFGSAPREDVHP